jgi:hypothetical protein
MASDATTEQAGETVAEIRWLSKIRSFVDEHFCWDKTGEPVDEAVNTVLLELCKEFDIDTTGYTV